MRKKRVDIRKPPETPFIGYAIVLLFFGCFLIFLWALVIVVRALVG